MLLLIYAMQYLKELRSGERKFYAKNGVFDSLIVFLLSDQSSLSFLSFSTDGCPYYRLPKLDEQIS